jgi:hypothetical protein
MPSVRQPEPVDVATLTEMIIGIKQLYQLNNCHTYGTDNPTAFHYPIVHVCACFMMRTCISCSNTIELVLLQEQGLLWTSKRLPRHHRASALSLSTQKI